MPSSPDPTALLRAHFQREARAIDRHPLPEQIVAYHERRLPPDEAEDVRAHLAACPDCTTQLLELAALLDGEDDASSDLSRAELDAAWERQRAQLFPDAPVVSLDSRRPRAPLRWAWATAASMGLAAALLTVVVDQRRTLEQLARPQANPPLVNLAPAGSVRQGLPEAPGLRLPADAERAWVILNPAAELSFPSYDVEVVAPTGEVVLRHEDLQSSEAANFRLEIPRKALAAKGDYRILLFGKKEGRRQALEEFPLRVH